MVLLICEGRHCNPQIGDVEEVLARSAGKVSSYPVGDEYLWHFQRTLQHTPHVMTSAVTARCEACGTERRYGLQF